MWDAAGGRWVVVQSNTSSPGAPSVMTYQTPNATWARRLVGLVSKTIEAQIISWGVDSRNEVAELALDYVELRVRYRQ
jgi:hypothetical protein